MVEVCESGDGDGVELWRVVRPQASGFARVWDYVFGTWGECVEGKKLADLTPSALPFGRSVAFLTGVSNYTFLRPKPDFALNDVDLMRDFLLQDQYFDEVYVVKDKAVTRGVIEKYFRAFSHSLTEKDRLIFYFAGHGRDIGEQGVLSLINDQPDDNFGDNFIRIKNDLVDVAALIPVGHLLFLLDSCSSGLGIRERAGYSTEALDVVRALSATGSRVMITAGTASQSTYEAEFTSVKDKTATKAGHGVFTFAFVRTAQEFLSAGSDADGFFTVNDVYAKLIRKVNELSLTKSVDSNLTPDIERLNTLRYSGTFVFLNPKAQGLKRDVSGVIIGATVYRGLGNGGEATAAQALERSATESLQQGQSAQAFRKLVEAYVHSNKDDIVNALLAREIQSYVPRIQRIGTGLSSYLYCPKNNVILTYAGRSNQLPSVTVWLVGSQPALLAHLTEDITNILDYGCGVSGEVAFVVDWSGQTRVRFFSTKDWTPLGQTIKADRVIALRPDAKEVWIERGSNQYALLDILTGQAVKEISLQQGEIELDRRFGYSPYDPWHPDWIFAGLLAYAAETLQPAFRIGVSPRDLPSLRSVYLDRTRGRLLAIYAGGRGEVWNTSTSRRLSEFSFRHAATDNVDEDKPVAAISADGMTTAVAEPGGLVAFFDAETGKLLSRLKTHGSEVTSLAFSSSGNYVASGGADGFVVLYSRSPLKSLGKIRTHRPTEPPGYYTDIRQLSFAESDAGPLFSLGFDGELHISPLSAGQWRGALREEMLPADPYRIQPDINELLPSPKDKDLLVHHWNDRITIWNLATQEATAVPPIEQPVNSYDKGPEIGLVAFSEDGTKLFVSSRSSSTNKASIRQFIIKDKIWTAPVDFPYFPCARKLLPGDRLFVGNGYSSQGEAGSDLVDLNTGNKLASNTHSFCSETAISAKIAVRLGEDDQSFVTWNLIDGKSTSVKLDHSLNQNSNLWALGDHLLVGSPYAWEVYDALTGKMTQTLESRLPGASHVVISKEGVLAVTIGRQGEATVSSLSTGATLLSLDAPEVRYAGAAFIGDDQHGLVALARENGAIEVWSPLSGELLYTIEGLSGPPQQLVYSQARGELFALSTDGTTTYWTIPTTMAADADALRTIANCYAAWDIGQGMKLLGKAPVCDKQTDSAITALAAAMRS